MKWERPIDLGSLEEEARSILTVAANIGVDDWDVVDTMHQQLDTLAHKLLQGTVWGIEAPYLLGLHERDDMGEMFADDTIRIAGVIRGANALRNPFEEPPLAPALVFETVSISRPEIVAYQTGMQQEFDYVGLPLVGVPFEVRLLMPDTVT